LPYLSSGVPVTQLSLRAGPFHTFFQLSVQSAECLGAMISRPFAAAGDATPAVPATITLPDPSIRESEEYCTAQTGVPSAAPGVPPRGRR